MALSSAAINFTTLFDLTTATKKITITDTVNYSGAGVLAADCVGVLTIVDPTGTTFYENTDYNAPDIDPSVSTTSVNIILIPTSGADLIKGIYTITYTVQYDNGVDPVTYFSKTISVDFNYCSPEVAITQDVDCVIPLFVSTDITQYTVNGVSPDITRNHQLVYPAGSPLYLYPVTSTGAVISVNTFYSGTQTTLITSTLLYSYPNGLAVSDVIQGSQEKLVDCGGICEIYCGIKALYNRVQANKGVDNTLYLRFKAQFESCMAIVGLAKSAIECDRQTDIEPYLAQIRLIGEFTEDCLCSGDEPTLITGLSVSGEIGTPWVTLSSTTNDASRIQAVGSITIDSITQGHFKYKKIGSTAHIAFTYIMVVTRSADTGNERFTFTLPGDVYTRPTPLPCSHGSNSIINISANPDIEKALPGLKGAAPNPAFMGGGAIDIITMPVATNTYFFSGAATYETPL